jgi:hypothetical protein
MEMEKEDDSLLDEAYFIDEEYEEDNNDTVNPAPLPSSPDASNNDPDSVPLYPGSGVTIGAFLFLLALFTHKYNLVGDAIEQLLNIIALALPDNHVLCTTLHEFKKFFSNLKNPLIHQHYCSHCLGLVEDTYVDKCPYGSCGQPFSLKTSSYFLEIPLANQIRNLFRQTGFYNNIQHRFRRKKNLHLYEDIYDGNLYRRHFDNNGILSDPHNLSFTFNTDGAPVFKSSNVSVWPIYLIINELPYHLRMKKENMILTSLWFGSSKPSMGTFLKPFQKTMSELHSGIQCESPEVGIFTCKAILLCGTADLPARSLLCNHIQYNGSHACWKCEQEGKTEAVGKGHARIFPFEKDNPKGPIRTPANVISNARDAVDTNSVIKGIKGPSWLQFFPGFHIIDGIAIDYMHGVLLGVQKLLLELWFLPKYGKESFTFHDKQEQVDERLVSIKPTLNITRLPRSIQDLKYWKASEYRSFLLYFGAPVLHDILDRDRFSHYLLLVNPMHILLKCGSTDDDVNRAEVMLNKFCETFSDLYDVRFMRLNVHQLLHLPDSVRLLGPLYTHSCFSFEDKNGVLLKMIRGTQNIDNQILTGVSFIQKLPELKENCISKDSECEKIYNAIESVTLLKRNCIIEEGIYVLGAVKEKTLSVKELNALEKFLGFASIQNKFKSFNRIEYQSFIIYGQNYSRMAKRDNSTIEYKSGIYKRFGQVQFFIFCEEQTLAFVQTLECQRFDEKVNILSTSMNDDCLEVIRLHSIVSNCMFVTYEGAKKGYVCRFPNRLECD